MRKTTNALRSVQGRTLMRSKPFGRSALIVYVGCPFSRTQVRQSQETIRRLRPCLVALDICNYSRQKVQIRPREVATGQYLRSARFPRDP
jgi:hypothetical protein